MNYVVVLPLWLVLALLPLVAAWRLACWLLRLSFRSVRRIERALRARWRRGQRNA